MRFLLHQVLHLVEVLLSGHIELFVGVPDANIAILVTNGDAAAVLRPLEAAERSLLVHVAEAGTASTADLVLIYLHRSFK